MLAFYIVGIIGFALMWYCAGKLISLLDNHFPAESAECPTNPLIITQEKFEQMCEEEEQRFQAI